MTRTVRRRKAWEERLAADLREAETAAGLAVAWRACLGARQTGRIDYGQFVRLQGVMCQAAARVHGLPGLAEIPQRREGGVV